MRNVWIRFVALVRAQLMIRSAEHRPTLSAIIAQTVNAANNEPRTRRVVILVGLSQSGKSYFRRTHPVLSSLPCVDGHAIHHVLNDSFSILQDGEGVDGTAYWLRQFLTDWIRRRIIEAFIIRGIPFVADSCHLTRHQRQLITRLARRFDFETTIIWIQPDPIMHAKWLIAADDRKSEQKKPRAFWQLVFRSQRPRFEAPSRDEADRVLTLFGTPQPNTVAI